jgi:predicted Zn-dependent protease
MHWIVLLLFSHWAFAHQSSITPAGRELFWPVPNVPIHVRTNTTDLPAATISSIIQNSMNEWNSTGVINVSAENSSNNEIRFSSNFSIYGSAVIGVTEISYNNAGAINKAVIILNDSYTFSSLQNNHGGGSIYLGDVVTHELGHLFGLNHSEVLKASMFYTSFPGQSTISADDRSGILQKYGGGQGSILGSVRGGNQVGVLGVHVQAISRKTNEVIGVITDENGNFKITGLDINDSYFIYTSPIKNLESLPGYFANVQNEFCPGSYSGSFFSACGREYEGFPQAITLRPGSETVDVGIITINCGLKANEEYSYQKIQSTFSPVEIWYPEEGNLREKAFVGYFMKRNVDGWTEWESLKADLSGVPTGAGRYLQVSFLAHPFGNLLEYEMRLLQNGSLVAVANISSSPLLGIFDIDMKRAISLSQTPVSNIFEIQIRAKKLANSKIPFTFPSPAQFTSDKHLPYLLILGIWEGSTPLLNSQSFLSDNESCLDAPFTFKVSQTRALNDRTIATAGDGDASKVTAASCGSIDSPRGGGPGNSLPLLVLGFGIAIMAGQLGKKSKNFLS